MTSVLVVCGVKWRNGYVLHSNRGWSAERVVAIGLEIFLSSLDRSSRRKQNEQVLQSYGQNWAQSGIPSSEHTQCSALRTPVAKPKASMQRAKNVHAWLALLSQQGRLALRDETPQKTSITHAQQRFGITAVSSGSRAMSLGCQTAVDGR